MRYLSLSLSLSPFLSRVAAYRTATEKNSEANNYSRFPDDSSPSPWPFVKSNLSAAAESQNHVKVYKNRGGGVRSGAETLSPFLKPPRRQVAQDAKVSSARKVLNIQYSPRHERNAARGWRVGGGGWTVAGIRSNFIFLILFRVPRRIRR